MTRDRSFLRRWSFFTGALLVLAEPARAKDLILFDGSSVAAVVYDANGDMPVVKIAQFSAQAGGPRDDRADRLTTGARPASPPQAPRAGRRSGF